MRGVTLTDPAECKPANKGVLLRNPLVTLNIFRALVLDTIYESFRDMVLHGMIDR